MTTKKNNQSTKKTAAKASPSKKAGRTAKVAKKAVARKSTKKPVLAAAAKSYPFESKRAITARLTSDDSAVLAAVVKLHELDAFMCSQKKLGATLATRVVEAGDAASTDSKLVDESRALALRYVRRLAKENRVERLASNPELHELARLFSATA